MDNRARQNKLDKMNEKKSVLYKECFGTPAGKKVMALLLAFYTQPIEPTTSLDMAFKCGQRDVVVSILESYGGDI